VLGVDRIVLAVQATLARSRRTTHLDHGLDVAAQEPRQTDPVVAGSLDAKRAHPSQRRCPVEQPLVAATVSWDAELAQTAADTVDHHGDMFVTRELLMDNSPVREHTERRP
jgi:hypothetical protein